MSSANQHCEEQTGLCMSFTHLGSVAPGDLCVPSGNADSEDPGTSVQVFHLSRLSQITIFFKYAT